MSDDSFQEHSGTALEGKTSDSSPNESKHD